MAFIGPKGKVRIYHFIKDFFFTNSELLVHLGVRTEYQFFGLYWLQRHNSNSLFVAPIHEGLALSIYFATTGRFWDHLDILDS